MGRNLARNFARHGHTVALHNRTQRQDRPAHGGVRRRGQLRAGASPPRSSSPALERPRRVIIMVKAGAPDRRGDRRARPAARGGRHRHRRRQRPLRGHPPPRGGAARARPALRRHGRLRRRGGRAQRAQSIMPGGSAGVVRRPRPDAGDDLRQGRRRTRAAPTSARTAPATSSRWCTTASSTPTCSSSPRPTTCSGGAGLTPAEIADVFREWNTRRPRLVPHRDHRRGARARSTPAPASRSSTSCSTRPSRRAPAAGPCRSRSTSACPVNGIAEAVFARSLSGARRPARRGRAAPSPGPDDRVGARTSTQLRRRRPRRRCTPRRWSPTPRAST